MECIQTHFVRIANKDDHQYAAEIVKAMTISAAKRGVNIKSRTVNYVKQKIDAGLAIIAVNAFNGEWIGFCCIEVWEHKKYIANSGLIVSPKYRGMGFSKKIKVKLFELGRAIYPQAKIFSLTTNSTIIHTNKTLGFKEVSYVDIMNDELFLTGCSSWVNFIELMNNGTAEAHHIAMVYDGEEENAMLVMANNEQNNRYYN